MEYRKVFLLSVVVFLSACAGKNVEQPVTVEFEPVESEYPITIPFEAGVGVEREIKLSDIADSVQYVPLDRQRRRSDIKEIFHDGGYGNISTAVCRCISADNGTSSCGDGPGAYHSCIIRHEKIAVR